MSLNSVTMVGRLSREPEIRTTNGDVPVLNCAIAIDRPNRNQDGERSADFFNFTAWRNTANFIGQYFHKGDMIGITGRLQMDQYTDREGNARTSPTIIVDNASFVAPRVQRDENQQSNGSNQGGYRQNNGYQQNSYGNQQRQQGPGHYMNSAPMPGDEGLPF